MATVLVALIGTGPLAEALVRRLVAAGHRVTAHDPSAPSGHGSATAAVEGAEVVITALPDVPTVWLVYTELSRTASPGQVFVDHSRVDLETSRWCALALPAFLDAPALGGPEAAARGDLTLLVGGEPGHLERAIPALRAYARTIDHRGPSGAGTAAAEGAPGQSTPAR